MPVVTRSQTNQIVSNSNKMSFVKLIRKINDSIALVASPCFTSEQKVITSIKLYSLLKEEIMNYEELYCSNKFVLTIYNKTFELETQSTEHDFPVDDNLVEKLIAELNDIRPLLVYLIECIPDNDDYQSALDEARSNMNKKQRQRRNIKRVNYAKMVENDEDYAEEC